MGLVFDDDKKIIKILKVDRGERSELTFLITKVCKEFTNTNFQHFFIFQTKKLRLSCNLVKPAAVSQW